MSCLPPEDNPMSSLPPIPDLPDFGWRVPLTYQCKVKCAPFAKPRIKQIPQYIGLSARYFKFWVGKKRQGRKPFIDHLNQTKHKPIYGCPIGGLGSGTIGRGYRGEFCRFQMVPGMYHYHEIDADQFIVCIRKEGKTIYQKVLSSAQRSKKRNLKSWDWTFKAEDGIYHALYPRAWSLFKIPECEVTLVCRQISPIIPHDYLETSLPAAAFVWEVKNASKDELEVSVTFTFKNGQGTKDDKAGGVWSQGFQCECDGDDIAKGVVINQVIKGMKCSYGVAAKETDGVEISTLVKFNPNGTGAAVWDRLSSTGQLDMETCLEPLPPTSKEEELAVAVCAKTCVSGQSRGSLQFSLTWDMPLIKFGAGENTYRRRYAQLYGSEGTAAPQLSAHTLRNHPKWDRKIDQWQKPILESELPPAWYKSAIFNELYFISDGGSIWVDIPKGNASSCHPLVQEFGRFGYLEGQEYRMFNTYDVHHYSSFAMVMLWPKLQLSIQYDFADTVTLEDAKRTKFLMTGEIGIRKVANCIPHDIGDPEDEPWKRVNAYNIHPTNDWKDLNLKFVLQVYRDFHVTCDKHYLSDMYPKCKILMEASKKFDSDDDGVIDNGGYADQTFDAWVMTGASSYCGGLWLACLRMMVEMAKILKFEEDQSFFQQLLDKGKASFEKKLWNGSYYNYDSSSNGYHNSVMADQLAGHWFLKASGLEDDAVFPSDQVSKALTKIFNNNVMGFQAGNMGAINGTRPDGKMDLSSPQSEEFWVGVTYALAATMIQEGMTAKGFKTAYGAFHICWDILGLHFQTPEAYTVNQGYRSLAYMRPLAIWAIQWALEKFHPHSLTGFTADVSLMDSTYADASHMEGYSPYRCHPRDFEYEYEDSLVNTVEQLQDDSTPANNLAVESAAKETPLDDSTPEEEDLEVSIPGKDILQDSNPAEVVLLEDSPSVEGFSSESNILENRIEKTGDDEAILVVDRSETTGDDEAILVVDRSEATVSSTLIAQ